MDIAATTKFPASVDDTLAMLGNADYIADRSLATAVHLALHLKRPLFLEGEAGVGKTEIAKVLATALARRLIRLQCYEGLDVASAVYEWDYARQMIEIRLAEAAEEDRSEIETTIFSDRFLIKRPLLQALEPDLGGAPVLLIDELDRSDEPFEAYLLEIHGAQLLAVGNGHYRVDFGFDLFGFARLLLRDRVERLCQAPRHLGTPILLGLDADFRQHQPHHLLQQIGVAPEDVKGLVENQPLVRPIDENRMQCPIEVAAVGDPDCPDCLGRVDDFAGTDGQSRRPQGAGKVHQIGDQRSAGLRHGVTLPRRRWLRL